MLQIKSINFSLLRVIECVIMVLMLFLAMKSKVLFSPILSALLLPLLFSCSSQEWDPEASLSKQNQAESEKQRICNLLKNSPTHYAKSWDKMRARVADGYVSIYVVGGYSCPNTHSPLNKAIPSGSCQYMYKMKGENLVEYKKCDGITEKSLYLPISNLASP